ncbi:hypothetical protein D1AOALGA4SA_4062 [Olavius algarvensis Delta 1 endosymbiont]|nr:hypothetical protein D1AOALGA4SA_4062 [Olavius algarvensis Delta 1 endosymbiont]
MEAKDIAQLLTALAGLFTITFTIVKYLSRRDKQIVARDVFQAVVESLSSEVEVKRLGGAILLRRFFDPETELGRGHMPYASEAMNVIAAMLRDVEAGNFQKLLADGLRSAPALEHADLQRTNLQKAYLGKKGDNIPNLNSADFYRADLSGASLKGANVVKAVFYQSRLHNTIFKNADLTEANFFEADLLGANFEGALLEKASFLGARNIPSGLSVLIGTDGKYVGKERFKAPTAPAEPDNLNVFLSRPGTLNTSQQEFVNHLLTLLDNEGISAITVERDEYPNFGAVAEVRRVMSGCEGAVILGFCQLEVRRGFWRTGTDEAMEIQGVVLPTAWNHVEAGMAAMIGLPALYIVEKGVGGGLLESRDVDDIVNNIDIGKPDFSRLQESITKWSRAVHEYRH